MVGIFRQISRIKTAFVTRSFEFYANRKFQYCGKKVRAEDGWNIIGSDYISVGNNFSASRNLRLQVWEKYHDSSTDNCRKKGVLPELKIGCNVSFISNCQVSCVNKVIIGDGCLFGDNVFVTDNYHGCNSISELHIRPSERKLYSKGPVIIGRNVWVGRNVCIMPNVTIGDGAVIGANSVVTRDIPCNCIAAGVPAKVVKRIETGE